MNNTLRLQIKLTQERLMDLRKRQSIDLDSSITTVSVYGTILAYRIKRMSFKEISKLIGVSAVATSKRLDKLIEYYRSRKPKMIFHQLEGETWTASNARKKEFEWNALMDNWAERHRDPFTLQSRIPFVISKTWR